MHLKLSRIPQLQVKSNMEKHKVIQEQWTTHISQSDWNLGKDGKMKKVSITQWKYCVQYAVVIKKSK